MTDLTEQWKNDELDCGVYYVQSYDGVVFPSVYSAEYDSINDISIKDFWYEIVDIEKVLAPVPSYEEWKKTLQALDAAHKAIKMEDETINRLVCSGKQCNWEKAKLKELLKGAKEIIEWYKADCGYRDIPTEVTLQHINQALGEDK